MRGQMFFQAGKITDIRELVYDIFVSLTFFLFVYNGRSRIQLLNDLRLLYS